MPRTWSIFIVLLLLFGCQKKPEQLSEPNQKDQRESSEANLEQSDRKKFSDAASLLGSWQRSLPGGQCFLRIDFSPSSDSTPSSDRTGRFVAELHCAQKRADHYRLEWRRGDYKVFGNQLQFLTSSSSCKDARADYLSDNSWVRLAAGQLRIGDDEFTRSPSEGLAQKASDAPRIEVGCFNAGLLSDFRATRSS